MAASRAPVAVHPIQRGAHRGRLQPARRAFRPTRTLQPCVINRAARRGFFDLASTSLRTEARRVSLIRYRGFRSRRGTPGLRRAGRGGSALPGERVYMLLGLSRLPWAQLKDFDRQSRPRIETRTERRGARWTYDVIVRVEVAQHRALQTAAGDCSMGVQSWRIASQSGATARVPSRALPLEGAHGHLTRRSESLRAVARARAELSVREAAVRVHAQYVDAWSERRRARVTRGKQIIELSTTRVFPGSSASESLCSPAKGRAALHRECRERCESRDASPPMLDLRTARNVATLRRSPED